MAKRKSSSTSNVPAKGTTAAEFNKRSQRASEVELKFLVPNRDRAVFQQIEQYFSDRDWIRLSRKNAHLLTRQLDTPDRQLLEKGTTLRIRGSCRNDNLREIESSDVCLKTGKTTDASGAIRRGEYEARTRRFTELGLPRLLARYPKEDFPELHDAVKGIRARDLREFFRIDCYRDRYVIELPEEVTGIKGKRFAAELILDDVAYVMDIPGLKMPLIFYHDLEVECETLFKPCDYDEHPDASKFVSSPMTLWKSRTIAG